MYRISIMVLLLVALLMAACGKTAAEEVTANYGSVREALLDHRAGTDIVGKTIQVVATSDSAAGVIYYAPDTQVRANVYVTIITNDVNRAEVLGIKKGEKVIVTVDSVDDHLGMSIYVFAKEYKKV